MKRWLVPVLLVALAIAALAVASVWLRGGREAARHSAAERMQCLPVVTDGSPRSGMVWVAGGVLTMGDTFYPEEGPLREVSVDGFWMDRTEVTNAEFAEFVTATNYVTVAERAVDTARHPGLPPDMQKPGAV
ncbi:MAG: SUMF1/EgtB/PvdO family nonheme iron enzyme, partial [Parvibaculum sp.]|nr:SUMF1/EgtB/PvdO family nonheme iron enzyme [Parvibaculum sp.]